MSNTNSVQCSYKIKVTNDSKFKGSMIRVQYGDNRCYLPKKLLEFMGIPIPELNTSIHLEISREIISIIEIK